MPSLKVALVERNLIEQSRFPDNNPNPVFTISKEGDIQYYNAAGRKIFTNLTEENIRKLPQNLLLLILQSITDNKQQKIEWNYENKTYLFSIAHIPKTNSLNLYGVDISDKKESKRKINGLSRFPSENPNPILRIDYQFYPIYHNDRGKILLEWNNEKKHYILNPEIEKLVARTITGKRTKSFEFRVRNDVYLLNMVNIKSEKYVNIYGTRISKQKRAELKHINEKERLLTTLRSIGEGVISTDKMGIVNLINPKASQLLGQNEKDLVGKHIKEILEISDVISRKNIEIPLEKTLVQGQEMKILTDLRLANKNRTEIFIKLRCSPIKMKQKIMGCVIVLSDVTNTRILENEAVKNQKLESIGILAGGIAHDFNNLLTSILGSISLAKLESEPQTDIYTILEEGEDAIQRAKGITTQLLTFSKGYTPNKKNVDIIEIIRKTIKFTLLGTNCTFDIQDNEYNRPLNLDSFQISQVIQNLVLNSVQAMEKGGNISVLLEPHILALGSPIPLSPGEYAKITFSDTGIGISEQNIPNVFDPYFSTKQKGNGLGLTMAFSIISSHDGYITIKSEIDQGTDVVIYLPVDQTKNIETSHVKTLDQKKNLRILVIEDDLRIHKVYEGFLSKLDHTVDIFRQGEKAIFAYKQSMNSSKKYDLVITDLTMPGSIGGEEIVIKLRKINQSVKLIIASGYSDILTNILKKVSHIGYLQKPFSIHELQSKISETLNYNLV